MARLADHVLRYVIKSDDELGGLQIGGGINDENAKEWLDAGASKVRNARRTSSPGPRLT